MPYSNSADRGYRRDRLVRLEVAAHCGPPPSGVRQPIRLRGRAEVPPADLIWVVSVVMMTPPSSGSLPP